MQQKIEKDLVKQFGSKDVVVPYLQNQKMRYAVKCQRCCSYSGRSLESHLVNKHKMEKVDAKIENFP